MPKGGGRVFYAPHNNDTSFGSSTNYQFGSDTYASYAQASRNMTNIFNSMLSGPGSYGYDALRASQPTATELAMRQRLLAQRADDNYRTAVEANLRQQLDNERAFAQQQADALRAEITRLQTLSSQATAQRIAKENAEKALRASETELKALKAKPPPTPFVPRPVWDQPFAERLDYVRRNWKSPLFDYPPKKRIF